MGYYAGDFYAGARGDPGFLGSLFGKVGGLLSSFIPGGSIVKEAAGSIISKVASSRAATAGTHAIKAVGAGLTKHPVLTAAGAAGVGALAGHAMHPAAAAAAARGMGRRRRRMNVCNPRALRRAIRRTHSFAKLAMKTIHLVNPKKKGRFGGFKKRRKR